jgi:hypothetical protein
VVATSRRNSGQNSQHTKANLSFSIEKQTHVPLPPSRLTDPVRLRLLLAFSLSVMPTGRFRTLAATPSTAQE